MNYEFRPSLKSPHFDVRACPSVWKYANLAALVAGLAARYRRGWLSYRLRTRLVQGCVLGLPVYARRNYWTTAGWEDDTVSDFDEGARRREGWAVGDARGRGEGAGAAVGGVGEAL